MSNTYIIYHNPRCSKSRKALEILESNNCVIEIREYLKTGIKEEEVEVLKDLLQLDVNDFLRHKEEEYKSKAVNWSDNKQAMAALVESPKILERPIVIKAGKAVIARPPEKVEELL